MSINAGRSKNELVESGINDGSLAFTGPYGLQIGLTGACNYICEFCSNFSSQRPEPLGKEITSVQIPPDVFMKLVSDAACMGVEQISIVGVGEPFLHPDIMSFIGEIKKRSIRLMITTNGSTLAPPIVDELFGHGLDILNISLNAATQETYTHVHGEKQGRFFTRVMDALDSFHVLKQGKEKPWISLRFVMTRRNVHELEKFIDLAMEKGANEIVLQNCIEPAFASGVGLTPEDKKNVAAKLSALREKAAKAGLKSNIDFVVAKYGNESGVMESDEYHGYVVDNDFYLRYPCYIGWTYVMILENGDVRPCCYCSKPLGNIYENSFKDIWFGDGYNEFRKRSKGLPKSQKAMAGCACFGQCGSMLDNIKTMERFKSLPGA